MHAVLPVFDHHSLCEREVELRRRPFSRRIHLSHLRISKPYGHLEKLTCSSGLDGAANIVRMSPGILKRRRAAGGSLAVYVCIRKISKSPFRITATKCVTRAQSIVQSRYRRPYPIARPNHNIARYGGY